MGAPAREVGLSNGGERIIMAAVWLGLLLFLAVFILYYGLLDLPALGLIAVPLAALVGILLLAHTQSGLIFTAFAIGPLGILQFEAASVTINLPEALILCLAAKELVHVIARGSSKTSAIPWRAFSLYFGASGLVLIYALLAGNPPIAALQDCRQFVEYTLLFFLLVITVREERQVRRIAGAFVVGITLLAFHGVLQRFTGIGIPGNQLLSDRVLHDTVRSGSFYGSTPLGALMVLGLGPALGLLLSARSRAYQIILIGCAVLMIAAAVFTNTRASWLAILLLLAVLFFSVRKSPVVIAMTITAVMLFSVVLGPPVIKRLQTFEISKSESSLLERIHYYTTAWHIFRHSPVVGVGWGRHYSDGLIRANGRYVATQSDTRPTDAAVPESTVHSAYLQLLVKGGAITLGSFLLLLLALGRPAWHAYWLKPQERRRYHLFAGLLAGALGYLFHATFENFFQWPVMSQAFWLTMALVTLLAVQIQADAPDETARDGA